MKTETSNDVQADLRLEMRVKNNVLWKAIHKKHRSVSEFCRKMKAIGYKFRDSEISKLLNFKMQPFNRYNPNEYIKVCEDLCTALGVPVEDLFPRRLYERVTINKQVIEINSIYSLPHAIRKEIQSLPAPVEQDPLVSIAEADSFQVLKARVAGLLRTLRRRERDILKMRFGLGEYNGKIFTYDEIATHFKITRERVRQVEAKAVRRLQHPIRARKLEVFVEFNK